MKRIHFIAVTLLCTTLASAAWLHSSIPQEDEDHVETGTISSTEEWNAFIEEDEYEGVDAEDIPGSIGEPVDVPDYLPALDTPFFVYSDPENRHWRGEQHATAIDKVGVHHELALAIPDQLDTLQTIGSRHAERFDYLLQNNPEAPVGKRWYNKFDDIAVVDGVTRVSLFAIYNHRPDPTTTRPGHAVDDGVVLEIWELRPDGPVMLFRTADISDARRLDDITKKEWE